MLDGVILAEWGVGAGLEGEGGGCWTRHSERSQPGTVWTSARCSLGETPTAEVGVQVIVWLVACMQAATHMFSKKGVRDDGKVVRGRECEVKMESS